MHIEIDSGAALLALCVWRDRPEHTGSSHALQIMSDIASILFAELRILKHAGFRLLRCADEGSDIVDGWRQYACALYQSLAKATEVGTDGVGMVRAADAIAGTGPLRIKQSAAECDDGWEWYDGTSSASHESNAAGSI